MKLSHQLILYTLILLLGFLLCLISVIHTLQDAYKTQALIETCEESLPRTQHCELVAKPKE